MHHSRKTSDGIAPPQIRHPLPLSPKLHAEPNTTALTILVISDVIDYELLRQNLQAMKGFKTVTIHAADLKSARKSASKQLIDIVFIDHDSFPQSDNFHRDRIGNCPMIRVGGQPNRCISNHHINDRHLINQIDKCSMNPNLLEIAIRRALNTKAIERKLQSKIIALNQANSTKRSFYALVSRELIGPLNEILGYSQAFYKPENKAQDREPYHQAIASIQLAGMKLHQIISDATNHNSFTPHQSIPKLRSVNLSNLLRHAIKQAEYETRHSHHRMVTKFPPHPIQLTCFPDHLQLAISNIITNAIQYSLEKSEIYLEMGQKGENVEIIVKDAGKGMSKSEVGSLPINQPSPNTSPEINEKRSGIGLSIAGKIIANHLGQLDIKSKSNVGTTVTIRIPL